MKLSALSLFWKTLRDLKWQVFCYGMGLALLAALVVAIYPSYRQQLSDFEVPEALKGLTGSADYGTSSGFLTAEFVSWVPLVTVIFAIMAGTSALAGEEANGTLDLLLSQPVSRLRLVVEKSAGILVATAGISLIACLGWLMSVPFVDIEISLPRLILATLDVAPITLAFAFLAMWAGVALPDRRVATGAVTAIAVAGFFLNYLAELVSTLKPVAWLSPFHYYDLNILLDSSGWWRSLVLLIAAALFAIATARSFEAREIGVGSAVRIRQLLPGRLRS